MTRRFDHDIIIVSVTDTQNICDNTVSRTRCCKQKRKKEIIITQSTNQRAYLTTGQSELCAQWIPVKFSTALSYSRAEGLCFASHSAIDLSLNDPVSPSSTWIFLNVSASVTISIIPVNKEIIMTHLIK